MGSSYLGHMVVLGSDAYVTLVLWLIYVAYLMLRIEIYDPNQARFAAILGIIGFVDVPLIRWSVKWRTLHQNLCSFRRGTTGLTSAMLLTFLVCLGRSYSSFSIS
jgi:heme exporter protein C